MSNVIPRPLFPRDKADIVIDRGRWNIGAHLPHDLIGEIAGQGRAEVRKQKMPLSNAEGCSAQRKSLL